MDTTTRRLELPSQLPSLEHFPEPSPRSSAQSSPVVGVPPSAMTGRAQDITDTVKQTPAQKKALKQANAQEWTTALSTANKELAPRLQTAKDTLVSRDHKFDVYGSKYLLAPVTGIVRMAHSVTLAVTNFFMAVINFLGSLSNCCGSTKTLAERREISKQKLEMCGLQMKSALNGLRQAIPGFGAAITSAKLEEARHQELLAATTAGRNITIHTAPQAEKKPLSYFQAAKKVVAGLESIMAKREARIVVPFRARCNDRLKTTAFRAILEAGREAREAKRTAASASASAV